MRVLRRNAHVDLATGRRRTDQFIGDGQTVDVPQWTPAELAAFREFERSMREEVIPEVERILRMRAKRAQESQHWLLY